MEAQLAQAVAAERRRRMRPPDQYTKSNLKVYLGLIRHAANVTEGTVLLLLVCLRAATGAVTISTEK
eukprot:1137535-Pelagomonas_calceolata.AAC.2